MRNDQFLVKIFGKLSEKSEKIAFGGQNFGKLSEKCSNFGPPAVKIFGKVSEKCSKFSPPAVKILEKSVSEIRQKLFYFLSQKCEQSIKSRLETKGGGVTDFFMS